MLDLVVGQIRVKRLQIRDIDVHISVNDGRTVHAGSNLSPSLDMAADAIKQRGMQWVVRLRAKSAAPVARSPERGKEIRLIRAAKRRRQQCLIGRRGERFRIGGEPHRHCDAP